MGKKEKFIILGLAGLLAISLFFAFGIQSSKQALLREYNSTKDRLTKESEALTNRLNTALGEKKGLQDRIDFIQKDLERISQEREELQRQYELLKKKSEALLERLRAQPPVVPRVEPAKPPQVEDAYWAEILKAKADLQVKVEDLTKESNDLRLSIQQAQHEKANLEIEITSLNREKQELEKQLTYNKKLADTLSTDLAREKIDKYQLQEEFKVIKNENRLLKRQLSTLDKRRLALVDKLNKLQQENENLTRMADEAKLILKERAFQMQQIAESIDKSKTGEAKVQISEEAKEPIKEPVKESIELPPIIVSPKATSVISKQEILEGKIITINEEFNFVVINLGQTKGVQEGMVFSVLRNEGILGKIKVIQIRKEIAACDIIQANRPFEVGDTVIKY